MTANSAIDTQTPLDGSAFWRFSLALYGDGTAPACLRLQDDFGADVNVVLFLLWRASEGVSLAASDVENIAAVTAPWRDNVVRPLRGVRRWLKTEEAVFGGGGAKDLRSRIKRIELESERLQQEALYAVSRHLEGTPIPDIEQAARNSLGAYANLLAVAFPPDEIDTLVRATVSLKAQGHPHE